MTVNELREEAKKLGYGIIKLKNKEKFEYCVCGHNRRRMTFNSTNNKVAYYCLNCNFTAPYGEDELDARSKWNEAIRSIN